LDRQGVPLIDATGEELMSTLDGRGAVTSAATSGWVVFAATMAAVAGIFNVIFGFVVLVKDEWVALTTDGILVFDLTAWGWILLVIGFVQIISAAAIVLGKTWARVLGVTWAALTVIGQMAFVNVFPIWSLTVIALSVLVIYGLTVHGDEVI